MMDYFTHNPIDVIKCQRDRLGDPVALNEIEVAKIYNAEFSSRSWRVVRDIFLFKPYSVELNEYAREIHRKYQGQLPEITNQGINKILKKIAFALNIQKDLSTSIGRKTYATLRYNQGMSVDCISDELGNTPGILNKHYIGPAEKRSLYSMSIF